jgi:DNA-binding HxlR family transcriptional regulator
MGGAAPLEHTPANCRAREVLDRVGDKWSLYVILNLSDGTRRFTELRRSIDGISQRMLTVTLKGLERDGIVCRTMYPVMPPHVDYTLTPVGRTLIDAVGALFAWAEDHLTDIDAARTRYDDARGPQARPPAVGTQLP